MSSSALPGFLQSQIPNPIEIRRQIDKLNRLARDYIDRDPAQGVVLSEQAITLANQCDPQDPGIRLSLAATYQNLGRFQLHLVNYDLALGSFLKSLGLYEAAGDIEQAAQNQSCIGVVYASLGAYSDALNYMFQDTSTTADFIGTLQP